MSLTTICIFFFSSDKGVIETDANCKEQKCQNQL